MSQCYSYLGNEKSCCFFVKSLNFNQVSKQFSSSIIGSIIIIYLLDELHKEVYPEFILENILHVNYEGVINVEQYVLLQLNVFELFIIDNNVLSDTFHSINLVCILVLHNEHLSECAFTDHSSDHKILKSHLIF